MAADEHPPEHWSAFAERAAAAAGAVMALVLAAVVNSLAGSAEEPRSVGALPPGPRVELLLYGRAPGSSPRLLADLPRMTEGRWSSRDEVQLTVRCQGEAFVQVVGVDGTGGVQRYFPLGGEEARIRCDGRLRSIGRRFRVGDLHAMGPVRIFGLFSATAITDESVRVAAALAAGDLRHRQVLPVEAEQVSALLALVP